MSQKIKLIKSREILDSRGLPTLETEVILENGIKARASIPSGASRGAREALELRDNDPKRFNGKGVLKACQNVNEEINQILKGIKITEQQEIDQRMIELDKTKNKSKLGANAILSVSLACARAGAETMKMPLYKYIREKFQLLITDYFLPVPMFNIFNGGKHADTNLDFQEFMVVPQIQSKFKEMLRMGTEIFYKLGEVLLSHGLDTDTGNEGGYAPDIISSNEAIELILEAIEKIGYKSGENVFLAIDAGASTFYNKRRKQYVLEADDLSLNQRQIIDFYLDWIKKYPLISFEDPLYEEDFEGWKALMSKIKFQRPDILIIGDDLIVTDIERLKITKENELCNAVIIKPNQVGTLTETMNCVKLAQRANFKIVVSHRSGETNDAFIADLAVAVGADFIKAGAPSRGERVAKYNRLLEIEEEIRGKDKIDKI